LKIAIVGFGMMGRQIAQVFAQHGSEVAVTDENRQTLSAGIDEIANGAYGLESAVTKGKITADEGTRALASIKVLTKIGDACAGADLVVEAVFENLALKRNVLHQIDSASPRTALIASNTSTLSISKIASEVKDKGRVVGLHFFNPVQVTKLVEIVKSDESSSDAVERAVKIVQMIGKTPIIAKDEPGFVANRLGLTLYMEASRLNEEGIATMQDIDLAMKLGFNHPMGPFETADLVGLDTRLRNLEALHQETGDEKWIPPKLLREMVNQGYLGDRTRKVGSKGGYYDFAKTSSRQGT
jgi:3-hydroxybutyryl-CoA dehydrogenase